MKILLVGAGPDIKLPKNVKEYFVCAVDGGYETCNKFGIIPNFYIGDKDSYSGQINCDSLTKDPHKDDSDMEIALNKFIKNSDEVYITGVLGGRLSHTIGNLMLLARKDYSIVNNVKIYGDKKVVFSVIGKQYVEADFSKYKLFSFTLLSLKITKSNLPIFKFFIKLLVKSLVILIFIFGYSLWNFFKTSIKINLVKVVEHPIFISPFDKFLKDVNSFSALLISVSAPLTYS